MRLLDMASVLRLLLIAIFMIASRAAVSAQTCDSSPLLIRGVTVWTSTGLLANRDVVIRDGRVASVEPAGSTPASITRTIDGAGQTMLPGLVDSHLHFSIPGGLPGEPGTRLDMLDITARQMMRAGVTSGRLHLATLEGAVEMKARGQDPCRVVPRLQVGGPGLSGATERDFANFQGARTADEGVAKVEKFAAAGVDWLAIHDAHRFAPGVLPAIVAAARKAGLRLMASGSTPEEIAGALSIHPDTLDYFDRTTATGYSDATLAQIRAQNDLILVPTPGYPWRMIQYRNRPQLLEDPVNFMFLSPADRDFVLGNAKKELDGTEARRWVDVVPTIANKMRQLRALGLPVAMGSDPGSTNHFQSNAIWWELEAWRTAGVSHRDALTAATAHGARVLRLDDIGHLRPGARGDFVLYRGNVEDGPFDVARVTTVGKGGVIVQ